MMFTRMNGKLSYGSFATFLTAMGLGMILGAVLIGRQKIENMHGITLFKVILAAGTFSLMISNSD